MLSERIAAGIASRLGYSQEQRDVIAYGLGAFSQVLLLTVIAVAFGLVFSCLPEAMIVLFGFAILRRACGGVHASTYGGCIFSSSVSIFALSAISHYAVPRGLPAWALMLVLLVPTFVVCGGVLYKKVPLGTPNKPLDRPEKRARLRRQAFLTATVYFLAAFALLLVPTNPATKRLAASFISVLWLQAFMLTSASQRLIAFADKAFGKASAQREKKGGVQK